MKLKDFATTLTSFITKGNEWTIRGFIDIFKNIYTISSDTKIVSKVLELHLFPQFLSFAESIGYDIELATFQNWYPDLTFICKKNPNIKFAVDLKTTYRDKDYPDFCNGFTLGSHGEYFINRTSTKNIQYPYDDYSGNTANIGSIQKIEDILSGNGVFAKAGEELFDDYWSNFGKIEIIVNGTCKKLSSFEEYLAYRNLPATLNNP